MATFTERMIGAARLDPATYEEVEADSSATRQALAVVVMSSLAAGIGLGARADGLVVGVVASLLGWYVWAIVTYWVGTRLLPEARTSSSRGELLRVIGFAAAPGMLRVVGIVPALRNLVFLVAALWMLVAGVVGVRQALDYRSTWRAVGVVALGWLLQLLVLAVLTVLVRGWA